MDSRRMVVSAWIALCVVISLGANGALPFVTAPTMGQAVWTSSFAQSIANQHLLALTANNFGLPGPAPIAFGLSSVYPTAILIWLGAFPVDAYTMTFAGWLGISFWGCYRLARRALVPKARSSLLATVWLCLPIVWGHAGFASLSLGIALLPSYLYTTFLLIEAKSENRTELAWRAVLYIAAAIVAIFMDGYTFMMFAASTAILTAHYYWRNPSRRKILAIYILPVEIVAFASAYLLYSSYTGYAGSWTAPLESFRGWGLDLSFLLIPSSGTSWILDSLHLSVHRSIGTWYGDDTVWETTYLLPLLLLGALSCVVGWRRNRAVHVCALIAIFGIYLSMGPSVKAWSTKSSPTEQTAGDMHFMPASAAHFTTGTAIVSRKVPGFKAMRASYRWLALGAAGCWLALVFLHGQAWPRRNVIWLTAATIAALLLCLPPPHEHLRNAFSYREMFLRMDREVVGEYSQYVKTGDLVAFLPYRNDFLMGYLAARTGTRTYNVGGDKNLVMAMDGWPSAMTSINPTSTTKDIVDRSTELLIEGNADAIVIPFFLEPLASHYWPCFAEAPERFSRRITAPYGNGWQCPPELAIQYAQIIEAMNASPYLTAAPHRYFAVATLKEQSGGIVAKEDSLGLLQNSRFSYPIRMDRPQPDLHWLLPSGWYSKESIEIWSSANARVDLPVPANCRVSTCTAKLTFWVFGAHRGETVDVRFSSMINGLRWTVGIKSDSGELMQVDVPLPTGTTINKLYVSVPRATSPYRRKEGQDGRILGIALRRIDIKGKETPIDAPKI
jgi:hypothetical protein